jgi:dTDP-4-amino-4,6-dideoxygalactose transaminase
MDVLQAAILNFRLKNLNSIIRRRRFNANYYFKNLNRNFYKLSDEKKYQFNSYHTFVVQVENREKLIKYLQSKGIGTAIHYPIPIHLQPASKYLNYKKGSFPMTESQSKKILTIPIHQNLTLKNLKKIVFYLNKFSLINEK